jgi:hypothetical protein
MSALRNANGFAGSATRHSVEARSILGLPAVRPPFLDDLSNTAVGASAGCCENTPYFLTLLGDLPTLTRFQAQRAPCLRRARDAR